MAYGISGAESVAVCRSKESPDDRSQSLSAACAAGAAAISVFSRGSGMRPAGRSGCCVSSPTKLTGAGSDRRGSTARAGRSGCTCGGGSANNSRLCLIGADDGGSTAGGIATNARPCIAGASEDRCGSTAGGIATSARPGIVGTSSDGSGCARGAAAGTSPLWPVAFAGIIRNGKSRRRKLSRMHP